MWNFSSNHASVLVVGTNAERGMTSWRKHLLRGGLQSEEPDSDALYNPPVLSKMKPQRWHKYVPILPQFDDTCSCGCSKVEPSHELHEKHSDETAHNEQK